MTKRKFKIFFAKRRAWAGLVLFSFLLFVSLAAPLLCNDKPLFLYAPQSPQNKVLFPIFFTYQPENIGISDSFFIDYKAYLKDNPAIFALRPFNFWGEEEQSESVLKGPSRQHLLGTDNLGRDVLARLIYGVRISLSFGIALWLVSYFIGAFVGAMQGYFLGLFDFSVERFKELSTIIPVLTLVILVTAITKQQSFLLILGMVLLFAWIDISSQMRASVLSLSKREFCEASKALGSSHFSIIVKHILPNSLVPIITLSPFAIEAGISLLAALDYLGFGLPPPTPSIGELLSQGRDNIQNAPWLLVSPIAVILLLLLSISFIGQALRAAFDPRS